jgi:hypothetical protein
MSYLTAFVALLLAVALPAGAQHAAPLDPLEGAVDIPVEEWSRMASGRTLVYRIDGALWAFEHYYPGGNRVTLQLYDGSCLEGTWDYAAPLYCFNWDGQGTVCFRHARRDGEILIVEAREGGGLPMLQKMTDVTDIPLTCQKPMTS